MKIKPAPTEQQPWLLPVEPSLPDTPFLTNGAARTHYGAIVQSAVSSLLELVEISNSGEYDIVFDAYHRDTDQFFEIKSVHATNKIPIYNWRIRKEIESGVNPIYLFAIHRVRGAGSKLACLKALAESMTIIVALSASNVERMLKNEKVRQLVAEERNSRLGYKRKGYCEGYRNLPVNAAIEAGTFSHGQVTADIYGERFSAEVWSDLDSYEIMRKILHVRANGLPDPGRRKSLQRKKGTL